VAQASPLAFVDARSTSNRMGGLCSNTGFEANSPCVWSAIRLSNIFRSEVLLSFLQAIVPKAILSQAERSGYGANGCGLDMQKPQTRPGKYERSLTSATIGERSAAMPKTRSSVSF
jgi:hypothetical protein